MYDLKYRITLKNYRDYQREHESRQAFPRTLVVCWWFLIIANVGGFLYLSMFASAEMKDWTLALINLSIAAFLIGYRYVYMPWQHKRNYDNMKFGDEYTQAVTDKEIISFRHGGLATDAKWDSLCEITQSPTMVFLWLNKLQAFLLPKSAFENQEEAERFVQYAKEMISSSSQD